VDFKAPTLMFILGGFFFFEVGIRFLQTFVFTYLSGVYFGGRMESVVGRKELQK
jgi:F0F1-type ATP synthase membrane subunit a